MPFAAAYLGSAYLWSGRGAEAVALLEEAVEAVSAMGQLGVRSWIVTALAEAYLIVGRVVDARERAEQAVALARAHRNRGWEAWGLKLLDDIHARVSAEREQRGAEQAGDAYRQALTLATELGMRPLVAHCHFGLGKVHAKTGQRDEAREHLDTAMALYREMDMRFWLEQVETEQKAENRNLP